MSGDRAELRLVGAGGEPVDLARTLASHGFADLPPLVLDEDARALEVTFALDGGARSVRVAPGDVLVTKVAGPALSQVLPHVAGVVAELGGSTSHLASLARERGIPMVLGVLDATSRIPDGSQVAVDGVAGVVRWMT